MQINSRNILSHALTIIQILLFGGWIAGVAHVWSLEGNLIFSDKTPASISQVIKVLASFGLMIDCLIGLQRIKFRITGKFPFWDHPAAGAYALIILLFPVVLCAQGSPSQKPIQYHQLDERVVYSIAVPAAGGGTTIMFPGAFDAISPGAGISRDPQTAKSFLIDFKEGGNFLTVRARRDKAEDVLTVLFNGKAYIFKLTASEKGAYAVYLYNDRTDSRGQSVAVSPAVVASLVDTAKGYTVLNKHQPEALAGIGYFRPARIMYYDGFRVLVEEVFRFESEDTIVFNLTLQNNTIQPISYKRNRFAVQVGDRIYNQSLSQASGVIPPAIPNERGQKKLAKGEPLTEADIEPGLSKAFIAITGSPDGHRNNLSVKNQWNILVVRESYDQHPAPTNESLASTDLPEKEDRFDQSKQMEAFK